MLGYLWTYNGDALLSRSRQKKKSGDISETDVDVLRKNCMYTSRHLSKLNVTIQTFHNEKSPAMGLTRFIMHQH